MKAQSPTPPGFRPGRMRAFTLVEVLVATAIFLVLIVMLASIVNGVSILWVRGSSKMNVLQNGRAVLDFIARDLRNVEPPEQSVRTPGWTYGGSKQGLDPIPMAFAQFIVNAGAPGGAGLTPFLPEGLNQVPGSGSFFGQMHGPQTPKGDLWIVGYYLAEDARGVRRLYRLLVAPDAADGVYKLLSYPNGIASGNSQAADSWIYNSLLFKEYDHAKRYGSSPVAENVAAFWVVALDGSATPIPWLSSFDAASEPLKFDSAACFVMPRGTSAMRARAAGRPTFSYLTASTTSPVPLAAHALPAALQITLVGTDDFAIRRGLKLPDPPLLPETSDGQAEAVAYQATLYAAKQRVATIISTRIELPPPRK
ncbi:hypothetical protein DB346_11190 [Verrucomicrobia bacterium LW23]|nr:hypothetical protein DB346_11190 [Verrucomicrobia bacterium LW23]